MTAPMSIFEKDTRSARWGAGHGEYLRAPVGVVQVSECVETHRHEPATINQSVIRVKGASLTTAPRATCSEGGVLGGVLELSVGLKFPL